MSYYRRDSRRNLVCLLCNTYFLSTYKGKTPKCRDCIERDRQIERAKESIGKLLCRWREHKISNLVKMANENDTSSIVSLLKQPDYIRLLQEATPELMREVPCCEMTSFRAYSNASLLSTLCARVDPNKSIPASLLVLIRFAVAALPTVLYPHITSLSGEWTHPVNFLCRGDPLFKQCRAALLDDVKWSPDIHPLLPNELKSKYVFLIKILRRNNIHTGDISELICSFLPPVINNQSSEYAFQTILEIADDSSAKITQDLLEEITLSTIAAIMSLETGENIYPALLRNLNDTYPGFFELEGVAKVPELRMSGNVCPSIAFATNHRFEIDKIIKKRIVSIGNQLALNALGLSSPCKVAMTTQQFNLLKSTLEVAGPYMYKNWLVIHDETAVEEAWNGSDMDVDLDPLRSLI